MLERRWARVLAALLPDSARRDLFEPAIHDLASDAAHTGRATGLASFLLFLDCWRLAPSEVAGMFIQDVRQALRLLARDPGFTVAAVLTLALGIGANVAVFAVVDAALLRPLPYPDADRLLLLQHRDHFTGRTKPDIAIGDYVDLQARQHAFDILAPYSAGRSTVFSEGDPFDVAVLQAGPGLLEMLGMRPAAGRALTAEDAREGAAPVVMLGYEAWRDHFGADPSIVGRAIKVGPRPRQVVGIAAPGFRFPANGHTDAIVPLTLPRQAPAQRKGEWVYGAGRLKTGVTMAQALADLASLSRQMEIEHPVANQGSDYYALTVRDALVGDTKQALFLLLVAVSLVMLIACVNVANLLIARAIGRRQEMAIRVALGAGRARVVAQALTESFVLATIAGGTGIVIAVWATPALVRLVPSSVHLPELATIGVDRGALAFTAGLTILTTLVFGLISAFGVDIDNAVGALGNPGRLTPRAAVRRASSLLVVVETALAIILLTGAGLVLRSFTRLLAVDPGFNIEHVLTLDIALPAERYGEPGARNAFYARALDGLRHLAAVQEVGAGVVMPLTGNNWTVPFDRADQPVASGQRPPEVGWQAASGGYFKALQIPLRAGRLFNTADRPGTRTVVIVSQAIQDRYFAGRNPVGKLLKSGDGEAEIVGVVGNIRRASLVDQPRADMYFALEQSAGTSTTLFFRTPGEPAAAAAAIRSTLHVLEPLLVIRNVQTLDDVARESVQTTRLALWLLGIFGASALALAAVGIYGVMSYSVKQRTREIGMRVALGATSGNILWLVMREGMAAAGIGAAIGLAAGLAAARSLSALLYGTSTADPLTLGAAVTALLGVALFACYLPARRATRVDPVRTLIAQ